MIVQFFLQVSECSLHLVVGIGHPPEVLPLAGKETRQVEAKAAHGCPQPTVRIMQPAVLVRTAVRYHTPPLLFNTDDHIFIVLRRLALYEGQIERLSTLRVQCEQHPEVAPPIRYVQMDKPASV